MKFAELKFITKIIEKANDEVALEELLKDFKKQDGTYEIDPNNLPNN